jgi:hypothetical protein
LLQLNRLFLSLLRLWLVRLNPKLFILQAVKLFLRFNQLIRVSYFIGLLISGFSTFKFGFNTTFRLLYQNTLTLF